MSESLPVGILLAISGGLMDAYSYLYRGQVFANAQTGNVLLFSVHLSKGEWEEALHYAFPIAAFLCGVALACFLCYFGRRFVRLHWQQICVLLEAAVLFWVARMYCAVHTAKAGASFSYRLRYIKIIIVL